MNLTSILKQKYPEGSIGPGVGSLQGECIVFLQYLLKFPAKTGDTAASKIQFVKNYGIPKEIMQTDFLIGDAVFFKGSSTGHGALITDVGKDDFEVAESNLKSPKRVSYGRRVKKNHPSIIGVGRFPFKFNTGFKTLKLRVCVLMNNYDKQWNNKCFAEIGEWFKTASGGKVEVDIFHAYSKLKNWWYTYVNAGGVFTETIDPGWFDENALPLAFTNNNKLPDVLIMAVKTKEWHGKTFNDNNLKINGGFYRGSVRPAKIIVVADEADISPYYFGKQLLQDLVEHEIGHYLKYLGQVRGADNIHVLHPQKKLEELFNDLDLERVFVNL